MLRRDEVRVYLSRCSAISNELAQHYREILSEEELQRNARYRFARDRHRDLIARALLRTSLAEYDAVDPKSIEIKIDEKGKPYLAKQLAGRPLYFNLSHSEDFILLAIAMHKVGIDVEYSQRKNNVLAIAGHYFFGEEIEELFAFPEQEQEARFFDYWTLKEAYMKARGEGISLGLSNFGFRLGDGIELRITDAIDDQPDTWQFSCLTPEPNYRVSIASNTQNALNYHFAEVIPQGEKKILDW